jgi:hypothetical protein
MMTGRTQVTTGFSIILKRLLGKYASAAFSFLLGTFQVVNVGIYAQIAAGESF